jgi:hypothetical protein
MKTLAAIAAAMLLTSAAALADGSVSVRVIDAASHKPVKGVTVTVESHAGIVYESSTDKNGMAHFLTVPDGRALAVVQDRDYVSLCQNVFAVSALQRREMTLEVASPRSGSGELHPRICALSNLVNPGEGADVYDIF